MPSEHFALTSPETGTTYQIQLEVPRALSTSQPVPAVLFMDGDDQLRFAIAAYKKLRRARRVQPLLLVGVGYGASYTKPGNKRGRDYTPTAHSDEPSSGGGDAFLTFLTNTLWSALASRYPLHPTQRGIAGHSLGSLLVLHALWREPLFFSHYLASAPSLWWDDRSILRLVRERHARNPVLMASLFLSVGLQDTASMTGDLALLDRQLTAEPFRNLVIHHERFVDKDHYNVLPAAFEAGLAALFPKVGDR